MENELYKIFKLFDMKTEAIQFFVAGSKKLHQANEELHKPKENVVSYLVCKNSQHAIKNYLIGYLLKNEIKIDNKSTIDSLLMQCIKTNKDFKKIDLSKFNCTASNASRYCSDVATVNKCHKAAETLENLLKKEKII